MEISEDIEYDMEIVVQQPGYEIIVLWDNAWRNAAAAELKWITKEVEK